jgi:hypothetical protein
VYSLANLILSPQDNSRLAIKELPGDLKAICSIRFSTFSPPITMPDIIAMIRPLII